MNEQTIKLLRELAEKLGTTAEQLWSVLVKQAPIDAVTDLLILAGSWVIFWILLSYSKKAYADYALKEAANKNEYRGPDPSKAIIFAIIAVVAGMASVIGSIAFASPIISGLFNPEYWALRQIIGG